MTDFDALRPLHRLPHERMDASGEPKSRPCATCPWRVSNHDGYPDGHHETIWDGWSDAPGLRDGGCNTCHTTRSTPCAGSVVLQQRELLRFLKRGRCALSRAGLERAAARLLRLAKPTLVPSRFADAAIRERVSMRVVRGLRPDDVLDAAHPALTDARIGHPVVAGVSSAERRAWEKR